MSDLEEEFVPEEESSVGPAALKSLREKLKKAVEEKQEYLEGWQRSRADFANYKREEAQGHGEKEERILAEFVLSLLPALDAFELALSHAPTKELQLVHKQIVASLRHMGVEPFGAAGEEFDPHRHEALGGGGEKVAKVERSGYKIGEKIIRPAHVTLT